MSNDRERGGCRIADIEVQSLPALSELSPGTVRVGQSNVVSRYQNRSEFDYYIEVNRHKNRIIGNKIGVVSLAKFSCSSS